MNKYTLILPDESTKFFKFGNKPDAYIKAFDEMLAYAEYAVKVKFAIEFVERTSNEGNMSFIYRIVRLDK